MIDTLTNAIPVTGLSIGGLVMLLLTAFFREWIYTRGAVVAERDRHAKEMENLRSDHTSEVEALREDLSEGIRNLRADGSATVDRLRADHSKQMDDMRATLSQQIADLRADRDTRIGEYQHEVADWREAYRNMEMALAAVRAQNGELLELARTSEHVLRSLPAAQGKASHD